jgi:hypothetical protein
LIQNASGHIDAYRGGAEEPCYLQDGQPCYLQGDADAAAPVAPVAAVPAIAVPVSQGQPCYLAEGSVNKVNPVNRIPLFNQKNLANRPVNAPIALAPAPVAPEAESVAVAPASSVDASASLQQEVVAVVGEVLNKVQNSQKKDVKNNSNVPLQEQKDLEELIDEFKNNINEGIQDEKPVEPSGLPAVVNAAIVANAAAASAVPANQVAASASASASSNSASADPSAMNRISSTLSTARSKLSATLSAAIGAASSSATAGRTSVKDTATSLKMWVSSSFHKVNEVVEKVKKDMIEKIKQDPSLTSTQQEQRIQTVDNTATALSESIDKSSEKVQGGIESTVNSKNGDTKEIHLVGKLMSMENPSVLRKNGKKNITNQIIKNVIKEMPDIEIFKDKQTEKARIKSPALFDTTV